MWSRRAMVRTLTQLEAEREVRSNPIVLTRPLEKRLRVVRRLQPIARRSLRSLR
jgi:hypothetical protein